MYLMRVDHATLFFYGEMQMRSGAVSQCNPPRQFFPRQRLSTLDECVYRAGTEGRESGATTVSDGW